MGYYNEMATVYVFKEGTPKPKGNERAIPENEAYTDKLVTECDFTKYETMAYFGEIQRLMSDGYEIIDQGYGYTSLA